MPNCPFCAISPDRVVLATDLVVAIRDAYPVSPGHTLVIPREPAATLDALSDESAAAIGRALPRLCRAVMKATGATEYNILQNNGAGAHQAVFHVHFHVIPKPDEQRGLGVRWPSASIAGDAAELARKLAAAVSAG